MDGLATHRAASPIIEEEPNMTRMRFNHMELSLRVGTLTKEFRVDVDAFCCDVLGWHALDTEVVGQSCHLLRPDDGQFIPLAEGKEPMSSPGYDHPGTARLLREASPPHLVRHPVHGVAGG
jgi:hypothetical protein